MSDLPVTDVQRILREHADFGHDVLQHPHQSVIEGKPYGMRSLAVLGIWGPSSSNSHRLESQIMQSERPLLSIVTSDLPEKDFKVFPTFPYRAITNMSTSDVFAFHNKIADETGKKMEYNTNEPGEGVEDIHKALQNHITLPLTHIGALYDDRIRSKSFHKNINDYSPPFDLAHALKHSTRMSVTEPFNGHITVLHHATNQSGAYDVYRYEPDTEKLHRLY